MHVIATAGHVDHGKSALVRAITGMEPDRWEVERRRGLTIDLGYVWFTLPSGERLAFVDVPGHERFVPNMLAGVGPVPAVMFVVAADGGWMPQSAEHLAAINALGIRHGLLAVTRSDLADPGPALRDAARRIAATSLGAVQACAVSAVTGEGIPELVAALGRLVSALPAPDPAAPVRLWVDRAFTIKGSGAVVTGTLPAGAVAVRDELMLTPSQQMARVRGLQSLKEPATRISGVARVALNLRGAEAGSIARGMALVTPGAWTLTTVADVRLGDVGDGASMTGDLAPPRELTLHIGSARTTARVRMLGGAIARLTLRDALPLHVGDRVLLRAPGASGWHGWAGRAAAGAPDHAPGDGGGALGPAAAARPQWPPLVGATVLDAAPPEFAGRGAAASAARMLAGWPAAPSAADLLRRHGLMRAPVLRAMGAGELPAPVAGDWLADPSHWRALGGRLAEVVASHAAHHPLAAGMPTEAARAALGLPSRRLVEALARPPLRLGDGVLTLAGPPSPPDGAAARPAAATPGPGTAPGAAAASVSPPLPERVMAAIGALRGDLGAAPFAAPDANRLRELGLDPKALAAASRARLLLRISDQIVLLPGADAQAARVLATLPQPFTTAEARQALGTTRRVAIPLLEHLDRAGVTRRLPDDRRRLTGLFRQAMCAAGPRMAFRGRVSARRAPGRRSGWRSTRTPRRAAGRRRSSSRAPGR